MPGHDAQDGTASYEFEHSRGYDDPVNLTRQQRLQRRAARIEHTTSRVALARIDRERKRLAAEEEMILSRPQEPTRDPEGTEDGPVVYFRKRYTADGNRNIPTGGGYQFAAVRVAGSARWFLSGPRSPRDGMSWQELLDFAVHLEEAIPQIWVATSWENVHDGTGPQDD